MYTFFNCIFIPNIWFWLDGRPFKWFRVSAIANGFFTDENHGRRRFWWALNLIFLPVFAVWLASYFQYNVDSTSCAKSPKRRWGWANFGNICQLSAMMDKLKLLISLLTIFLLFQIPNKLGGILAKRFDREHSLNKEINIR